MEILSRADRIAAVTAAAAHDSNEELTIILNAAQEALRELGLDHPARAWLISIQIAAMRLAWQSSALLNFARRKGAQPSAATVRALLDYEPAKETAPHPTEGG